MADGDETPNQSVAASVAAAPAPAPEPSPQAAVDPEVQKIIDQLTAQANAPQQPAAPVVQQAPAAPAPVAPATPVTYDPSAPIHVDAKDIPTPKETAMGVRYLPPLLSGDPAQFHANERTNNVMEIVDIEGKLKTDPENPVLQGRLVAANMTSNVLANLPKDQLGEAMNGFKAEWEKGGKDAPSAAPAAPLSSDLEAFRRMQTEAAVEGIREAVTAQKDPNIDANGKLVLKEVEDHLRKMTNALPRMNAAELKHMSEGETLDEQYDAIIARPLPGGAKPAPAVKQK